MANAFSVPDTSSSAAVTDTAIVGDNPTPFGSAVLGTTTTDVLTTGDLSTGDAGDMGSCASFAVELWVQWTVGGGMPGVANTFIRGPLTSGGTQWGITIGAGSVLSGFAVDDTSVTRTATASTVLLAGFFYHVVFTAQGGNLNVYLNGVLDGTTATWGSHTVLKMGTTAGSEDMRIVGPSVATTMYADEVAVYRLGLTAA